MAPRINPVEPRKFLDGGISILIHFLYLTFYASVPIFAYFSPFALELHGLGLRASWCQLIPYSQSLHLIRVGTLRTSSHIPNSQSNSLVYGRPNFLKRKLDCFGGFALSNKKREILKIAKMTFRFCMISNARRRFQWKNALAPV